MESSSKLPLRQAIRVYWARLLLLPLFVPFAAYFLHFTGASTWSVCLVFASWLAASFYADWPRIQRRVGWSYWFFATFIFVVGGFFLILIIALSLDLFRWLFPAAA